MKLNFTLTPFIATFFLAASVTAQTTTPAMGGTTFSNNSTVGTTDWADPSGAQSNDATFALQSELIVLLLNPPETFTSHYLMATGFDFSSIPAGATILGVTATVEHERQALISLDITSKDHSVKLIVGGAIVGTEHASSTLWSGAEETYTYGGAADTWGTTLTEAQVKASNFGLAFSADLIAGSGISLAATYSNAVNYITMSVTYQVGSLPITIQSFSVLRQNNANVLNWSGTSNDEGNQFVVQRSGNSKDWQNLTSIPAQAASEQYSYTDATPLTGNNFYRLYLQNKDAQGTYSAIQEISQSAVAVSCYPNPFIDQINISSPNPIHSVVLRDLSGRTVLSKAPAATSNTFQLPAGSLPPGIYLLQVDGALFKLVKQ